MVELFKKETMIKIILVLFFAILLMVTAYFVLIIREIRNLRNNGRYRIQKKFFTWRNFKNFNFSQTQKIVLYEEYLENETTTTERDLEAILVKI